MDNKINVSVDGLIIYVGELYQAADGLADAVEKAENERRFSEANIKRLKEACSEIRSLADSARRAALEYEGLEKNIVDVLTCV